MTDSLTVGLTHPWEFSARCWEMKVLLSIRFIHDLDTFPGFFFSPEVLTPRPPENRWVSVFTILAYLRNIYFQTLSFPSLWQKRFPQKMLKFVSWIWIFSGLSRRPPRGLCLEVSEMDSAIYLLYCIQFCGKLIGKTLAFAGSAPWTCPWPRRSQPSCPPSCHPPPRSYRSPRQHRFQKYVCLKLLFW